MGFLVRDRQPCALVRPHVAGRGGWVVVAVVVLAASLAGLGALRTPVAHADTGLPCSWYGEADQRDVNIGAPDLNAQYLYGPLDGVGASQVEITGAYPHARYFSFTLYGNDQQAETSIYDQQIAPDPGSYNPYTGPGKPGEKTNYTVHVLFENAPAHPAQNTVYAGPVTATNPVGFMVLRIYIPRSPSSPSGDVPWPQIKVIGPDGVPLLTEGACATIPPSFGAWYWKGYAQENSPAGQATPASGTTAPPQWTRSFSNGFGNQQNSYLQVLVSHHWGQLVVAHFKGADVPEHQHRPARVRRLQHALLVGVHVRLDRDCRVRLRSRLQIAAAEGVGHVRGL